MPCSKLPVTNKAKSNNFTNRCDAQKRQICWILWPPYLISGCVPTSNLLTFYNTWNKLFFARLWIIFFLCHYCGWAAWYEPLRFAGNFTNVCISLLSYNYTTKRCKRYVRSAHALILNSFKKLNFRINVCTEEKKKGIHCTLYSYSFSSFKCGRDPDAALITNNGLR